MAAFTYKKTSTTSMKVTGILNPQTMVINVDGEDKQLSTLLRDFADLPKLILRSRTRKNWMNQLMLSKKGVIYYYFLYKITW